MATFLLEVGTEELPASFVSDALHQWQTRIPAELAEQALAPEAVRFYGTPRRLAVMLDALPLRQPDRQEEVKGPPAQAAFKDGQPTKAAEGFAKSRGVDVSALEVRDTDKGSFVFVNQDIPGRAATDILTELIPQWILGLEGKRFMRWGDGDLRFPRPIRWLVALMDNEVLPITLENGSLVCTSDRISQGHRVLHPKPVPLRRAQDYVEALRDAFVEIDPAARRLLIQHQVEEKAKTLGGVPMISADLLDEVTNLVEWPTAVVGKFDTEFLDLPPEVAIIEMESHQRYFPLKQKADGLALMPSFITISNGDPSKDAIIAEGNARVIRARLSDGKFFFDADRAQPLDAFVAKLETVTFEERLGSMAAKVKRIGTVADHLCDQLNLGAQPRQHIRRAAYLCKADLVTQMVGEFPELQGVMGQKYALHSSEPEAVATAIVEHYLPKGAQDSLPQTLAGQVVGIADRLDTLVGIFSTGQLPTGSSDPFALRRAANAVLNIIWAAGLPLNLAKLLDTVVQDFAQDPTLAINAPEALRTQLHDFFLQRVQTLLQDEQGIDYDLVNAVLSDRALSDPLDVKDRALFLQAMRRSGRMNKVYETVNRATRLAAQGTLDTAVLDPEGVIAEAKLEAKAEHAFLAALKTLVPETKAAQASHDYDKLVAGLEQVAPVVSGFFDGPDSVLVMADEPAVRQNRLNLLGLLRNHALVLGDFGAIVKG
ncbi:MULTISPECIES: glycine--tRNA ligase subunit beta [Cyanophyceae]|uniref:Glycine--tRNA ligase beta subunit n=1 Tax=Leptolyngbya subtilissima DQ-A4 TaxID=2933933 RepID=A0ABV0JY27_9CYAN|nr:glycine--tRNA ligase subunit beta [Nodosilinea sp. FACHB-141]MBD2112022.1 glycine--tRNA ligase subunit beta [Nodosilinea sp. FACHB-141]